MIITDADAGMTVAVEKVVPDTVHLFCLWHVMKNVRKNCARALGKTASRSYRLLYAAAFAATEEVSALCARRGTEHQNARVVLRTYMRTFTVSR